MSELLVGPEGLKAHYDELYRRYGASHQAVQWSSRETQERRFEVLCDVIEPADSVIDVGCGLGDLLGYLRQRKGFTGRYLGLDFVPGFVEHEDPPAAVGKREVFGNHEEPADPRRGARHRPRLVAEVFDAEAPFTPRGCIAQAWSVAEFLRAWIKLDMVRLQPDATDTATENAATVLR